MAEDVIDIRKRIEEMRNEVSSALADGDEVVIPSAPAGEVAEFTVPGVTGAATARKAEEPAADRVAMKQTKVALDDALQLPSVGASLAQARFGKYHDGVLASQTLQCRFFDEASREWSSRNCAELL